MTPHGPGLAGAPLKLALNMQSIEGATITFKSNALVVNALRSAIDAINQTAGRTIIDPAIGVNNTSGPAPDGISTVSFAPRGVQPDDPSTMTALTDNTGKTTEADITLSSDIFFSSVSSGTMEQQTYDLQAAFTHELLRAVGLQENDAPDSSVRPLTPTDDLDLRTLSEADRNALEDLYPPPPAPPPPAPPPPGFQPPLGP